MGRFTIIPQNTFDGLQMDAGILLKRFNPASPAVLDEDIITATTGGIKVDCIPSYSDLGEDVDNCPNNMKELKHLDSWDCKVGFTALGTSADGIRLALGCADIDAERGAIVPRKDLEQTDFSDIWWVGDRADGGLVAVQIKNALSTSGFSLQTTKNGKGQISVEITGHVSINAQSEMPMKFYSLDPDVNITYKVMQTLSHVTSNYEQSGIASGEALSVTLTAEEDYTIENVIVMMGNEDVTESSYSAGTVSISSVSGDVQIIATATGEGA